MTREHHQGLCEHCGKTFAYYLIHNGFNESCYAYCAVCGMTALLDTQYRDRGRDGLPRHHAIRAIGERFLVVCSCGGSFLAGAAPRCPHCHQELSAKRAATWIERAHPGTGMGWLGRLVWRWQRNWDGMYAIIIEGRYVTNPWRDVTDGPAA